jgi:isocitrate dehydrogenase (NAD+)
MSERYRIALLPGDGIGPEVAAAARSVVDATGLVIEWLECRAGADEEERSGEALPESVLALVRSADATLKGPVGTPIGKGFQSVNVRLRRSLDLYASLRPVKSLRGVETRFENVDLVVVRENTEGLYTGIEHVVVPGVVESLKVVTERACTRIAEFAFDYAPKSPAQGDGCETAIARVLEEKKRVTRDLGGSARTIDMAKAIAEALG